jgi:hypothetical protein
MTLSASGPPRQLVPINHFLREVLALAQPGEYLEVRHQFPNGGIRQEFLQHDGRGNWFGPGPRRCSSDRVLFGLNPRWRPGGDRAAVHHQGAFFFDLDDREKSEAALAKLSAAGLPPSAVVKSGSPGHLHLYLFLTAPVPIIDGESVARRLCHWLGSDPVFYPNVSPTMPGSLNLKDPLAPRRVELVEMLAHRYDLRPIIAKLDSRGVPPAAALTPAPRPARPRPADVNQVIVDPGRINLIWDALPRWAQNLIRAGKQPGDRYPSRSEADCAVVRVLLDAGASEDEVVWLFANNIAGIGGRYAEQGDRYLSMTIDFIERNAPAESWAFVERVDHRGPGSRVVLDLRVYFGAHAGAQFQQGVESTRSVWPYLFRSAGFLPAAMGDASRALALVDRDLRLALEQTSYAGTQRLQVKRFLPRIDT